MTAFVDLEMSTNTAVKLLKFIAQQEGSDPDLGSLFLEIERQVKDSIEYESQYVQGTLHKKPTNQHSLLGSINFLTIFCLCEIDFLSTRPSAGHSCIEVTAYIYSNFFDRHFERLHFNRFIFHSAP